MNDTWCVSQSPCLSKLLSEWMNTWQDIHPEPVPTASLLLSGHHRTAWELKCLKGQAPTSSGGKVGSPITRKKWQKIWHFLSPRVMSFNTSIRSANSQLPKGTRWHEGFVRPYGDTEGNNTRNHGDEATRVRRIHTDAIYAFWPTQAIRVDWR